MSITGVKVECRIICEMPRYNHYRIKEESMVHNAQQMKRDWPETNINGLWVLARPVIGPFWSRVKDAWGVLTGRYDAIKFYRQ
jgi:hypothetical protein